MSSNPTARDYNKASVLDAVLSEAPLTRNRLIELTRLSQATVSRKVDELRFDGFVVEQGVDAVVGRGRRSTYLDVPGTAGHIVGISFGARTTCVLVTDLRGREVRHVIVPSLEGGDGGTTAEWLVDLIVETSDSAEGPLRQIVAALPGRVRNGTKWSGTAESRKIFMDSLLQNSIEDRLKAPVILESDASASLRGILKDDASIANAALFMLSTVLSFASCTDHEIAQGRTPTFGDLGGVLFSGVGNETLDGLLSTRGLLQFARGRGLDLEGIEALWSQPQESGVPRGSGGGVYDGDRDRCRCRCSYAGPGVRVFCGSLESARGRSPSRGAQATGAKPSHGPGDQGRVASDRTIGGPGSGVCRTGPGPVPAPGIDARGPSRGPKRCSR